MVQKPELFDEEMEKTVIRFLKEKIIPNIPLAQFLRFLQSNTMELLPQYDKVVTDSFHLKGAFLQDEEIDESVFEKLDKRLGENLVTKSPTSSSQGIKKRGQLLFQLFLSLPEDFAGKHEELLPQAALINYHLRELAAKFDNFQKINKVLYALSPILQGSSLQTMAALPESKEGLIVPFLQQA